MKTFEELAASPGYETYLVVYGGKHEGAFVARKDVEISLKHGWFGANASPRVEVPPPVPEPGTVLLAAAGLVCVYLWSRHVRNA